MTTAPDRSAARDRLLFPFRWLGDSVRSWWFCGHHGADHSWTWDDLKHPYCEVCGVPGSVIE